MGVNLFSITILLSVTGSAAYLLLKLLSATGGERLSQNWRYRGAVTVSLLFVLPFYKLWALLPSRPRILVGGGAGRINLPPVSTVVGELPGRAVGSAVDWAAVADRAAALWLLTAACLIIWNVWRLLRCRRRIEQNAGEVDGRLQQTAREAAYLAGVSGEVRLLASPAVQSPMLVGFFRPTVALPSERLPDSDARLILTHELTHFRRGDLWKKLLVNMIQCVHWFNPLVYLLSRDFAYWQETSCDERVVGALDHAQRKEYGYLLINYAPTSRRAALYVSFAPCRYKLKRRISTMMRSNKKYRPVLSRVLALALAAGCVTATSAFAAPLLPEAEPGKSVYVTADVVSEGKYQVKTGTFKVVENGDGLDGVERVLIRITDERDGLTCGYYPADIVDGLNYEVVVSPRSNGSLPDGASVYYEYVGAGVVEAAQSVTATLVSVSRADESKFTPEKWSEIMEMIDAGTVVWED